jgi:hypothetical protein
MHIRYWWEKLRQRGHSKNPDLGGRRIIKWIFKKWVAGHYGAQDYDKW